MPLSTRRIERDEALLPTHAVQRVERDESDRREPGHDSHEAERFAHRHDREDAETHASETADAIDDGVLTYDMPGHVARGAAPGVLKNASEAVPQAQETAAVASSNQMQPVTQQTEPAIPERTDSDEDTPTPKHVDLYA